MDCAPIRVLVEGSASGTNFSFIDRFVLTREQFFNKSIKHFIFNEAQNYNYYKITFESSDQTAGLSMLLNGELSLWQ